LLGELDQIHSFFEVILSKRGQKQHKVLIYCKLKLSYFDTQGTLAKFNVCIVYNDKRVSIFLIYLFGDKCVKRLKT